MATIVVSIIVIAMIVVGGITLSQGMLTSADSAALSVEEITLREGEIMRTTVSVDRASYLSWADLLRVKVKNTGQTKLAGYDKWDFIVDYTNQTGDNVSLWLPYTVGSPGNDEWQNAGIFLNGAAETFEPGIIDPGEEMIILAKLASPPADTGNLILGVSTFNGIPDNVSFYKPGYTLLVPHTENTTVNSTRYYQLVEAAPADASGTVMTTSFVKNETARKLLCNQDNPSREARHVFQLIGVGEIPASTWTFYYRCTAFGDGQFPQSDGDIGFDVDILIRKADGSIRDTLASGAAPVYFPKASEGEWTTLSGTYDFPGYMVIDQSDHLEIAYYGNVEKQGPSGEYGYMQLSIDDDGLDAADLTRIEAP